MKDKVKRIVKTRGQALDKEPSETKVKGSHIASDQCLPSGITLLNLALSGRASGGYPIGFYFSIVGDSDTMKTLGLLTAMAQAAKLSRFDNYKLIHDDVEESACWDMDSMFGPKLAPRLQSPSEDGNSFFVENFYKSLDDLLKANTQFIYGCDSMDALEAMEEFDLFQANNIAMEKGKDTKDSFGIKKARLNSQHLRKVKARIRKNGSILFIVSQTREKIGAGPFAPKDTYSGGRAIKFYSAAQIWMWPCGAISKEIKGKKRKVGNVVKVRVDKNHLTGKKMEFMVPVFYSRGIDDVACCVDWLLEEGFWKKKMGFIESHGLFEKLKYHELIRTIRHDKELAIKLRKYMQKAWDELEIALKNDEDAEVEE